MSGAEWPQTGGPESGKKKSKGLLPVLLLLLLACGIFAGAVLYLGGPQEALNLIGLGAAPPAGRAGATTTSSTPDPASSETTDPVEASGELNLPPGVSEDLAKRMYVEQIQSQANLRKLADGDLTLIKVTSVELNKRKTAGAVFMKAFFSDGTSAPGVMQMVYRGDNWYIMSVTGLSDQSVYGSAKTVQRGTIEEGKQHDKKVIRESGIEVFDVGVMNTMLAEQRANQEVVRALLGKKYSRMEFGDPLEGSGTTTVPSKATGKKVDPLDAEAALIEKTVDDSDYIFLASFRMVEK
ncbi:MAG: hypothetical protein HGB10_00170 [Coriobacteriia bacterium]|nr:hypothetical protein [Coriobacteriia bacterium]